MNMNDHNRIVRLEDSLRETKSLLRDLLSDIKEQRVDTKNITTIITNLQPIIGRLIAAEVTLETKGLINDAELKQVTEQKADEFISKANPQFVESVRGKSLEKPVAENNGPVQPEVSGAEGAGVTGEGASD